MVKTSEMGESRKQKHRESRNENKKVVTAAWNVLVEGFVDIARQRTWQAPARNHPDGPGAGVANALGGVPIIRMEYGPRKVLLDEYPTLERLQEVLPIAMRTRSVAHLDKMRNRVMENFKRHNSSPVDLRTILGLSLIHI